jgi:chorismate synthase
MLRYLTSGESHGSQLTAIIDGLPAGLPVDRDQLMLEMGRRQGGYGRGGRMKIETDEVKIVSGVRRGKTMGGPVTLIIENKDWENWRELMDPFKPIPKTLHLRQKRLAEQTVRPRPGHADLAGGIKWNHHDLRNVLERASARETAARTATGALAKQFLSIFDISIASHVVRIEKVALRDNFVRPAITKLISLASQSDVRCISPTVSARMIQAIRKAKASSDTVGGVVEVIIASLPIGLGGFSQWDQRLDGRLGQAMLSLHSVKGVEIGAGFQSAALRGSKMQDPIRYARGTRPRTKGFYRTSNNAGGLEAGITNGEEIIIRLAAKPISTLTRPLETVNVVTKKRAEAMVERTDTCVIPALGVVAESVAALVFTDAFLQKFGCDNMTEIKRNYASYLRASY